MKALGLFIGMSRKSIELLFLCVIGSATLFAHDEIATLTKSAQTCSEQEKSKFLIDLGKNYYINDNYALAEAKCKEAIELSIYFQNKKTQVDALNALILIYSYYDTTKTKATRDASLNISEKINYVHGKVEAQTYYCRVLKDENRLDALELLRQMQKEATRIGDKESLGIIYTIAGEIHRTIGNFFESTRFLLNAQKCIDDVIYTNPSRFNKYLYGVALANLAATYNELKNHKESERYYGKFLKVSQDIDDIWSIATCYNNLGVLNMSLGKMEEAQTCFEKAALEYRKLASDSISAEYNLSEIYLNGAEIHLNKNHFQKAFELLNKAIHIFEVKGDLIGKAHALAVMSEYWAKKNQYNKAEMSLIEALDILEKNDSQNLKLKVYAQLSEIYQFRQNYQLALIYFKKYSELKDIMFNAEKTQEIGSLTTVFENERKIIEEKRGLEIENQKAQRLHTLEYSGISLFVLILFILLLQSHKFNFTESILNNLLFVAFLIAFQFLFVLLSPIQSAVSVNDPFLLFMTNVLISLMFMWLNAYFEKKIRHRIESKASFYMPEKAIMTP